MALKGKRVVKETLEIKSMDIISERGIIVTDAATAGFVTIEDVDSNTTAVGLLLDDVENRDLTQYPSNQHKNLAQVSGVVSLAIEGQFLTDQIPSGVTIAQGDIAYLEDDGQISNSANSTKTIIVGTWMSAEDSDGYARLNLKL